MKSPIFLLFFFSHLLLAQEHISATWTLQITDHQYELKHQKLPNDREIRPYLKKTGWRCYFSKTEKINQNFIKKIRCNFSVAKSGEVRTALSCSKKRPYDEIKLELVDERRESIPPTIVFLTCKIS